MDKISHEKLVTEHISYASKIALKFCRKHSIPNQLQNDLLSAAQLGLVEAASRFDTRSKAPFTTFAYRRIEGAIVDELRVLAKESQMTIVHEEVVGVYWRDPERELENIRKRNRIRKNLRKLSGTQRRILYSYHLKGLPLKEIAEQEVGRSRGYVSKLYQRALKKVLQEPPTLSIEM